MRTVAIIGCGRQIGGKEGFGIAYAHADGWLLADPDIRILAVDIDEQNLRDFAEHYSLPPDALFGSTEALYREQTPDFVDVCTWPALHRPMVIEAANAGAKGILCEKPMALNMAEIREMLQAADEHGAILAIGHQRRYNPRAGIVKDLLAQGAIGERLVLEARVPDGWDLLSYGVHWFDMVNYLLDSGPDTILAGLDFTGERRYRHAVENASVTLAEYPGGHQGLFVIGPPNPQPFDLVARGSDGMVALEEHGPVHAFTRDGYERIDAPDPGEGVSEIVANFRDLTAELIAAVETGAPLRCDVRVTAVATEMAFAAHQSARDRRKVVLPVAVESAPLEGIVPVHEGGVKVG